MMQQVLSAGLPMEPGYALPAVAHRSLFPAVLTTQLALDRKCMTFLKPRTNGNSSSYLQSVIEEAHSEEWARQTIRYLSDCERHMKMATFIPSAAVHIAPPPLRPLPLAQWFEDGPLQRHPQPSGRDEGVITSTYGRILKMYSTKKVRVSTVKNIENRTCILTTKQKMGLLLSGAMSGTVLHG